MATHLLQLTTAAGAGLTCVQFSASLAAADVATMDQKIADDQELSSMSLVGPTGTALQNAIVFTADTVTTALSGLTSVQVSSPTGATISNIRPGNWIYGPNIPAGAQVLSVGTTSIHLTSPSDTPTANAAQSTYFVVGRRLPGSFSQNGELFVPNRGVLKMFPGDTIAVDASGFPFLLSKASITYAGSSWIFI